MFEQKSGKPTAVSGCDLVLVLYLMSKCITIWVGACVYVC